MWRNGWGILWLHERQTFSNNRVEKEFSIRWGSRYQNNKSDVFYAIRTQSNARATGPDRNSQGHQRIWCFKTCFTDITVQCHIYGSGKIPSDRLNTHLWQYRKKRIRHNVMTTVGSSYVPCIQSVFGDNTYQNILKCEYHIEDDTPFGFRNSTGTQEALFSLNVLTQRCRHMNFARRSTLFSTRNRLKHFNLLA